MNITEEQVERALFYLRDSAEDFAHWKSRVEETEYLIRIAEAKAFLEVETGAQEYKKSVARASIEYHNAVENYTEAVLNFTKLQANRKASELAISVYQSSVKAGSQGIHI